jgi:hypothetical protein
MKTISFQSGNVQNSGLRSIIRELVLVFDPEKILLLSVSYDYFLTENIYLMDTVQELKSSHYNLLILSDEKERKSPAKEEIIGYNLLKKRRNLQLQVMDIIEFNDDLISGKEYANHILLNAMLWYDKEKVPLAYPEARG